MARKKCSRTNKTRFPNELEAKIAMANIQRKNSHFRHQKSREDPTRVYRCEFCGDWHMTSQTKDRKASL